MRSSIACVRCRRSKVKCVNTGPNTTCKACETSNRECTYPPPNQQGVPRSSGGAGGGVSSVIGAIAAAPGSVGGGHERNDTPKKPKVKKPAPNANAAATTASMNTPKVWKECLDSSVLTQTVWKLIFDAFQQHHSPMLPFLHPPTFLTRLRASASNPHQPSGSSPPAPEKPHSPLLLLGMLALTSRYIPSLVQYHSPALPTPLAVSEFYASALKYRLQHDEESEFLVPSLEKVQALLMLSVHEWGQTRNSEAYMWLGLAIRMAANLELPWVDDESSEVEIGGSIAAVPTPSSDGDAEGGNKRRKLDNGTAVKTSTSLAVLKEARRRTFWAVFTLDRALSVGRAYPSGISSTDASRVQLPCEEKLFMFGTCQKQRTLNSDALLAVADTNLHHHDDDPILAQIVKAFELYGAIQKWLSALTTNPSLLGGPRQNLSAALDRFIDSLPQQLEFSLQTLQIHTSTNSASAYALLHATLLLSRISLEEPTLPADPLNTTSADTTRLFSAARDLITLVSGLEEWSVPLENPFFLTAIHRAAALGLYAYHFPWLDPAGFLTANATPPSTPHGTGEEPRKAAEFLARAKPRWKLAQLRHNDLSTSHQRYQKQKEDFVRAGGKELMEKRTDIIVNFDERQRLFTSLAPPPPKKTAPAPPPATQPSPSQQTVLPAPTQSPQQSMDTLLAAATAKSPPSPTQPAHTAVVAPQQQQQQQGDRWMAVNTVPKQENGHLEQLARFAAGAPKMEGANGASRSPESDSKREVKQEEPLQNQQMPQMQSPQHQQQQQMSPSQQPAQVPQMGHQQMGVVGQQAPGTQIAPMPPMQQQGMQQQQQQRGSERDGQWEMEGMEETGARPGQGWSAVGVMEG